MFFQKNLYLGGWSAIIEETFYIYNGSAKRIKRWKHEKEKTYAVQHHLPHHGVCDGGADDGKRSGDNRYQRELFRQLLIALKAEM